MNFLNTFLMWFPPCALFCALAYVTEFAWRAEDRQIILGLKRRFWQAQTHEAERRVILQEDGAPLMYLDDEQ